MTAGTFEFDTTGFVSICREPEGNAIPYRWSDLPNDFVRGYIRAAFADAPRHLWPNVADFFPGAPFGRVLAFSDLHPDTLESMLADCEAIERNFATWIYHTDMSGGRAWAERQAGKLPGFPPIRLSLDQNGKVIAHV